MRNVPISRFIDMAGNALKIIVGLGNPGAEYARTRHNAGFWLVDELARRHGGTLRHEGKHQAELARIRIGGDEVWLMKPMTFMNRSGGPISSVLGFYKLSPREMLVAHDEIDLPSGTVRLKDAGGHGGHNGMRDVIAAQGDGFWRLRIGVGHPGNRDEVADWVLCKASPEQCELIESCVARSLDALDLLINGPMERAMMKIHAKPKVAATAAGANGAAPAAPAK